MKKSTLIIVALAFLANGALRAEQDAQDGQGQPSAGAASKQAPLLLASTLPGVRSSNPVQYLPGMSQNGAAITAASTLPLPVITDLTNYPNPFDSRKAGIEGTTVISYMLANDAKVTITLFDLLGHKVREWNCASGSNGARQGANAISWDGTNAANQKVSKGGYIAEIVVETPQTTATVIRKIGVIH